MAFSKEFKRRPPRVSEAWTKKAVELAQQLTGVKNLPQIYVADLVQGKFEWRSWNASDVQSHTRINIPLWATDPRAHGEPFEEDYFEYYIAHELAHYKTWVSGYEYSQRDARRREVHGKEFYKYFEQLCRPELRHYEYDYLNASATKYMGPKK